MWALVLLLGLAVAQDTGVEPAAEAPERACPVPDVVRVGAYLNDLQELDVKAHSYEFDGYVWFKWCNPDLDPVTTILSCIPLVVLYVLSIGLATFFEPRWREAREAPVQASEL